MSPVEKLPALGLALDLKLCGLVQKTHKKPSKTKPLLEGTKNRKQKTMGIKNFAI